MNQLRKIASIILAFIPYLIIIIALFYGYFCLKQALIFQKEDTAASDLQEECLLKINLPSDNSEIDLTDMTKFDYAGLHAAVPSASGYISVPNTSISYPIMYEDQKGYYLTHLADGTTNRNGAIYLSTLNSPDFSDPVNYIFGHNMRSGYMFSPLNNYLQQSYFDKHGDCYIVSDNTLMYYKLFYAKTVPFTQTAFYFNADAIQTEEYQDFIQNISEQSAVTLPSDAELIVLGTCTKNVHDTHTFVYGYLKEKRRLQ